ncbi:MAG: hypothetical protein J2P21_33875 [Chloracidobacterium sp.]|nr:hypothetical protein [Chloracidobacterium sp.]
MSQSFIQSIVSRRFEGEHETEPVDACPNTGTHEEVFGAFDYVACRVALAEVRLDNRPSDDRR